MVSVPVPREFQYIARSTIIFLVTSVEETITAALPVMPNSPMLKVLRELAGMVSFQSASTPADVRYRILTVTSVASG